MVLSVKKRNWGNKFTLLPRHQLGDNLGEVQVLEAMDEIASYLGSRFFFVVAGDL